METEKSLLILVGLMGSGKTTVGRQIARRLGLDFVDSDHEIEAKTGVSIPTIFEIEGEEGFRRREAATILELCRSNRCVLATGGGAVLNAESRRAMRDSGWVVYLNVPPQELYVRTQHDRNRPLLQTPDPLGRLRVLYEQRDPLYREVAHLIVDGGRGGATSIVNHILREYEKVCRH